jgi:hypothetical protein
MMTQISNDLPIINYVAGKTKSLDKNTERLINLATNYTKQHNVKSNLKVHMLK